MASKHARMRADRRGEGQVRRPGLRRARRVPAPLQPANFDGPGRRFLCLDHVREHNAKYSFFDGMSPDEIHDAQSALAGWERPSRGFAGNRADPPPRWATSRSAGCDFRPVQPHPQWPKPSRFSKDEQQALSVHALAKTRTVIRSGSAIPRAVVRRFHPDKNGGDRSHEVGSPTSSKPANCCERRRQAIAIRRAQREMVPEGRPHRPRGQRPDAVAAAR